MNYRRGSTLAACLFVIGGISLGAWVPEDIQGASYPRLARSARIMGVVTVEFKIGADGTVADAKALSGPPLLRAASVQAAKQWHFKANKKTGSPFQATFDFRLAGSCRNIGACNETVLVHYPDRIIITSEVPTIPTEP